MLCLRGLIGGPLACHCSQTVWSLLFSFLLAPYFLLRQPKKMQTSSPLLSRTVGPFQTRPMHM